MSFRITSDCCILSINNAINSLLFRMKVCFNLYRKGIVRKQTLINLNEEEYD